MIRMLMRLPRVRLEPGQLDNESTALAGMADDTNLTAVPPDDVVADRQTETGTTLGQLGGVEGLKDLVQLREAIPDRCPRRMPRPSRRRLRDEPLSRPSSIHGIDGIDDQIGEHLLQLAVVDP